MRHILAVLSTIALAAASNSPTLVAQEKPKKPEALTFSLSAHVAPAPAQVSARIRVEPDERSRELLVEWWTEEGVGGSHVVSLDGERAAPRQDFPIKRMEEGDYMVSVALVRADGSMIRKRGRVIVVGEGSRFVANPGGTDLMVDPSPHGAR